MNIDIQLLLKRVHCELSAEEEAQFQEWVTESIDHQHYYDQLALYHGTSSQTQSPPVPPPISSLIDEFDTAKTRQIGSYRSWFWRAAASVLLVVGFYFTYQYFLKSTDPVVPRVLSEQIEVGSNKAILELADGSRITLTDGNPTTAHPTYFSLKDGLINYATAKDSEAPIEFNTLRIPRGGEYQMVLSDGTQVWLNSETEITFPNRFTGEERLITLKGEAYFDVVSNAAMPFVVVSENQRVTVLGTQFNVSAYAGEGISTTLVEGKVNVVALSGNKDAVKLSPGMQSRVDHISGEIDARSVDVELYIAWIHSRFLCKDQDLESILKALGRWYDFEVDFKNPDKKEVRFTGELQRYDSFEKAIEIIALTQEIKYEINGKKLTIL